MPSTSSKAAMRVLITALLATSAANAAALPHEVVDARAAAPVQNAQLAAEAIQAAASAAAENPSNFFEDISDELNNRTAWEVFRDFFTRLFGPREDDNDDDTPAVVTVTVTPTPEAVSSAAAAVTSAIEALSSAIEATSSVTLVLPPGPSEVVSEIVSTTSTPLSELIMSILPIGDLTTSINATTLPAIFSTAPEEIPVATPSVIDTTAPFPILNATSDMGMLPTAVSITGEFSVSIPLVTDVPTPANSTLPEGTGISLPYESDLPINATATIDSTTIVIVTETVTPVPIGTAPVVAPIGTDPASVSVGTGLPIVIVPSALWPNSTYGEPTVLPVPAGTGLPIGTGLPLGTGISIPLGTGSAVLPTVPLSTGIPLLTGTGSIPEGTALPIASPLYPNTTSSVADALTLVVPVPIYVTGIPDPVVVNVTIPAANATTPVAPEDPSVSVTAVPITVTGIPGAVFNVSVTIPVAAPFANATTVETAVLPVQTSPVPAVSAGTGLPVASLSADASAPFANTTIVVVPTDAPVVIVGPDVPAVETPVVEPGQLSVSVSLTGDYSG